MTKITKEDIKLNWMEAALKVSCNVCEPLILRVIKNKMIDNQVNTLIGVDKEFSPLKPADIYTTMCLDCKSAFKNAIVQFIINSESSPIVRERLFKEINNGHS